MSEGNYLFLQSFQYYNIIDNRQIFSILHFDKRFQKKRTVATLSSLT